MTRRQTLSGLETRQRLAARDVSGSADRESEHALALAEQARDLGSLVTDLDKAGTLAEELAHLPGPVLRPARPETSEVAADAGGPVASGVGLSGYMLPMAGRLVSGFGDTSKNASPAQGVSIATLPQAQVVAPAAGRVAFAGPYRGFGQIIIIEHPGGWTSLITGLAQLDARARAPEWHIRRRSIGCRRAVGYCRAGASGAGGGAAPCGRPGEPD